MRFHILGQLRAFGPGGCACRFEPREQRMLAVLLLAGGSVVTRACMIDAVWEDAPPATAGRQLLNCISRIRAQLRWAGSDRSIILSDSCGYRVRLRSGQLDAQVFTTRIAHARHLLSAGHLGRATRVMRDALALWSGPVLAGVGGRTVAAGAARLEEQRLKVLEQCLELELAQDRQDTLVGELTELVAIHPLRERFVGLLMRALYRTGRTADALAVYQRLSARLADDLGIDPCTELQGVHTAILRNDALRLLPG